MVGRSIYSILGMLLGSFYKKHVHLPADETSPEIKNKPKLYPYFQNVHGAIDGSHLHAWVLSDYQDCQKKGQTTTQM